MTKPLDNSTDLKYNEEKDWRTLLYTVTKIDAREVYRDGELPLEFVIPSNNSKDTFY